MGEFLVVSLTMDEYVRKGPGRPLYKWADRAQVLRALRYVDAVIPTRSAIAAMEQVRPEIFVKGIDYASRTQWTEDIEEACEAFGCKLRFTSSPKQSVTDVIRRTMEIGK